MLIRRDRWKQIKCVDCGRILKHSRKEPRNKYKVFLCLYCLRSRSQREAYHRRKFEALGQKAALEAVFNVDPVRTAEFNQILSEVKE